MHASCAAWEDAGVLIAGAPGSGKSDLLLRLIDRGFALVADDQVVVDDGWARAPASLAGLIEIRGLGVIRLPFLARARLILVVKLVAGPDRGERMPDPTRYPDLDLPMVTIDPGRLAAPFMVSLALRAAQGKQDFVAGAFETRQQEPPPS